jgi:hypothetical protein
MPNKETRIVIKSKERRFFFYVAQKSCRKRKVNTSAHTWGTEMSSTEEELVARKEVCIITYSLDPSCGPVVRGGQVALCLNISEKVR